MTSAAAGPVPGETAAAGVLATALLLRPQTRATGDVPLLAVHSDAQGVPVDLLLESRDFARYQAALTEPATGATIWRSDRISPASFDRSPIVCLIIPARMLKAQHYSLDLSGIGAAGPERLGSYAFRAMRR